MVKSYASRVEVLHHLYGVVSRRVGENGVDACGTVACCSGFFREPCSAKCWWWLPPVPVFEAVEDQPSLDDFLGVLRLAWVEVQIRADDVWRVFLLSSA